MSGYLSIYLQMILNKMRHYHRYSKIFYLYMGEYWNELVHIYHCISWTQRLNFHILAYVECHQQDDGMGHSNTYVLEDIKYSIGYKRTKKKA